MPLTPKQKNAQSYNAIKDGLYSLNKFISKNGSDDLFTLFTESKKIEIDDLFFTPPKQSNPGTSQKGKVIDLLKITNGWFINENKHDPENFIREKIFGLFSFGKNELKLRNQLTKEKNKIEQEQINILETFEKNINGLTLEQTFIYINLYISARWDNIVSLIRLQEIQNNLSVKKFTSLSREEYEKLIKQDPNQDLSFSKLGHVKDWSAIKKAILNDLLPPQTDSLSTVATPSSSNNGLNSSINAKDSESPTDNPPVAFENSDAVSERQGTILLSDELEKKNQEIAQLKNTKEELEEKFQSLETVKAKLENQISGLEKLFQNNEAVLQQESESNKQQLDLLKADLGILQKKSQKKESEFKSLKEINEKNLLSLQGAKSDLQKTQNEKNDFEIKLKETQVKIKKLEVNNTELSAKIEKTNIKLKETSDTLEHKSSDHSAVSKQLNDLQTQHNNLQTSLKAQKKLLQEDLQSKEDASSLLLAEISKLNNEIGLAKNKLKDTEQQFAEARKKRNEFQEIIKNLTAEKFQLKEQKDNLAEEKKDILAQLTNQTKKHQTLSINYGALNTESENTKTELIAVTQKLQEQTEFSKQLQIKIEDKTKLIGTQLDAIDQSNKTSQASEKELQGVHKQLEALKQKYAETEETGKIAIEELAENVLKIKKLEQEIKILEPLSDEIFQEKEKNRVLSINVNSEKDEREKLGQQLNELSNEVSKFFQIVENELDKLNPDEKQTHKEIDSVDPKYQIKPIHTLVSTEVSLDEDEADISIVSNNDQAIEKLDHLKQQLISKFYNLKVQDERKIQLLEIKQREIDILHTQYKDLEKTGNTLINENTKKLTAEKESLEEQVTSLTNKLIKLEQQNKNFNQNSIPPTQFGQDLEFDNDDYLRNPVETGDSDSEEETNDYQSFAVTQDELVSTKALLSKAQAELAQKSSELTELQQKMHLQTDESNLNQKELKKEIEDLQNEFHQTEHSISRLTTENENLNRTLKDIQADKLLLEEKITNLEGELDKLRVNDSSTQEALSKVTNQIRHLEKLGLDKENYIQELNKKLIFNSSLLEDKETQIKDLSIALMEIQKKSEQLENRNLQLKEQTTKERQDIVQLTNNEIDLSSKIKELTVEKENLNTELNQIQVVSQNSKDEIVSLKTELDELNGKDLSNKREISDLENHLDELNEFKSQHEKLIQELNEQIKAKENIIDKSKTTLKQLDEKLLASNKQVKQLEIAKSALENLKSDLENKITELNKKNSELQQKLNQSSVNDKLIAELKNTISIYVNKLIATEKEIETLKEKLESSQKDDSNLIDNYASLDRKLSEKTSELNEIKTELEATKNQLEEARVKIGNLNINSDQIKAAKQLIQEELANFNKERDMKDGIRLGPDNLEDQDHVFDVNPLDVKHPLISPSAAQSGHSSTSSGNSSRHSSGSSPTFNPDNDPFQFFPNFEEVLQHDGRLSSDEAFSEGSNVSINDPETQPQISETPALLRQNHSRPNLMRFNSDDSLDSLSSNEDSLESPIVPIINSINGSIPMPRPEQQGAQVDNTSSIHARGVTNAFKEENHEQIRLAFTAEFSRIATAAATTLFSGNIVTNSDLPTFKNELDEKANEEIKTLISALSNNPLLLSRTIEKIHNNGLAASTYLEEVKNSASGIFESLTIKRQGQANQTFKDHIKGIGENLLINLCVENLETKAKANLIEAAITTLTNKVTDANLNSTEHAHTIKTAAKELVTNLLETQSLKAIIERLGNNPIVDMNLLDASKQKLQETLLQQINLSFDDYFPNVHLDPIFEKINNNSALLDTDTRKLPIDALLSEDEKQMLPSELQYADTVQEFVSGLRVKYSYLPFDYESKVNNDSFKSLRLILRKQALSAINQTTINDNEIIDLNAEAWLVQKQQLITGRPITLESIKLEKEQKDWLDELSSSLDLSALFDIAIAGKTISDLTNEIDKANKAQASAAEQISQLFQEIDRKQAAYPKLIDDDAIAGFRANLNQHLENLSIKLTVDEETAKILLIRINQRLKKDISKWDLFDNNKLQKEITNDILTNRNFAYNEAETEKLVHYAMSVLRENYPNDTVRKREQWLKDITLLHAATKKLVAFSKKIEKNKAKFITLSKFKKEHPISQSLDEKTSDVYLPKSCALHANSFDPSFRPQPNKGMFKIDTIFYKQDGLKINQTLTFSQTLSNKEEKKWSVSRIDDTCLVYQTHKSWLDVIKSPKHFAENKMTYVRSNSNEQFNAEEQVLFAELTHAVKSSKDEKICKISILEDCTKQQKQFISCFIDYHNTTKSGAEPMMDCPDLDTLKMHKDDKVNMMNKIQAASNLYDKELKNAKEQSDELVNQRTMRPRG
jgi:chromosome segregation ATPase